MRKRIVSGIAVTAATILVVAWLFGWFGEDPALAEVKAIQERLANLDLSETDFRATMTQLRKKMEFLSESSRRLAWQNGRAVFERREMSKMERILAMKPQERVKALDGEINRMERRRAEWQQRASQSQNGNPSGRQRGEGGARRRGAQTDEQRIARLRNRLDRSTPQQRAVRSEFMRLINERRNQRGLPPIQRGRG